MIAIPAIDLRGGACVQLVGGDYAEERVRLDDPVAVARHWTECGFQRIHLVDLDAATGHGDNQALVREIIAKAPVAFQVGGGLRDVEAVERLFADGADRVIVGTRAIEESDWIARVAAAYPDRLIVAADVRERQVVTHGWSRVLPRDILDVAREMNEYPLAGLLVTAVHREGRMMGGDLSLMKDVVEASRHPVLASGGISSMTDLHALAELGVSGAILGMALYTGALDSRSVAEVFVE